MDKQELQETINQALLGHWMPIATICGLIGVIITLGIIILKIYKNHNDKRHDTTEEVMAQLTKNQTSQELILERLTVKSEGHDREIGEIKKRIE